MFANSQPVYSCNSSCMPWLGISGKKQTVTCDNAESISAAIQKRLSEKLFIEFSFSFTAPYDEEDLYIDPLTLSLHLVLSIERKPETEIGSYFQYKLTPSLASLFHNRAMRLAKKKSSLKKQFLANMFFQTHNE